MYRQLTREQRYAIYLGLQEKKTYTAICCWTLCSGGLFTDAEAAEDCAEDLVGGDFAGD